MNHTVQCFTLNHQFNFLSKSVKFLAFPSDQSEAAPLCGGKGNCTVPTQRPFLPKNPANQTVNATSGKLIIHRRWLLQFFPFFQSGIMCFLSFRLPSSASCKPTHCWRNFGQQRQMGLARQPALERETRLWRCHHLPSLGHYCCPLLCWVRHRDFK